jgi:superfamily II DNA or RNA helicase
MSLAYADYLADKRQLGGNHGFEPVCMPDRLFPFQRALVEWAVRKGRGAILANTGLGKSGMQLAWADNVARKTNGRVLVLTPLAVGHQTVKEGEKFGIEAERSSSGIAGTTAKIIVANYERLHYFDPSDFVGVVCDESSRLKDFSSRTKAEVTEFMRTLPYRLLCTATPAPNDYHELGTSSEALGYLGYQDMLSRYFKEADREWKLRAWSRVKYRFRGHAEEEFWRWVCSWARSVRRPSDIGFPDDGFDLPPLIEHEHVVEAAAVADGFLFAVPARNLREEQDERRRSIPERCEIAAEIMARPGPCVAWVNLNDEGDELARLMPDAKQVSGSMKDEAKEEVLLAFQSGQLEKLIIKPKIGCYGLNWQHCGRVVTFASHSFEQHFQLVRRCWRYPRKEPVEVHVIASEGEAGVLANLKRKSVAAERMFDRLVRHMNNAISVDGTRKFASREEAPRWLTIKS